jgi:hypothetical protein
LSFVCLRLTTITMIVSGHWHLFICSGAWWQPSVSRVFDRSCMFICCFCYYLTYLSLFSMLNRLTDDRIVSFRMIVSRRRHSWLFPVSIFLGALAGIGVLTVCLLVSWTKLRSHSWWLHFAGSLRRLETSWLFLVVVIRLFAADDDNDDCFWSLTCVYLQRRMMTTFGKSSVRSFLHVYLLLLLSSNLPFFILHA